MSKRQSRGKPAGASARRRRNKVAAAITMALTCILGTSLLAQVSLRRKGGGASSEVSLASFTAGSPSKEYIYVGGRLVATEEPENQGTDNAAFVSQTVPLFMIAGQGDSVSVTMQNTGTTTWTSGAGYKLGSQNPQDNSNWGSSRASLPSSVAAGSQVTFAFAVTAPTTVGTPNFQWRMIKEGSGYFGIQSTNVAVVVSTWTADTDGDGIPNGVESGVGRNPISSLAPFCLETPPS